MKINTSIWYIFVLVFFFMLINPFVEIYAQAVLADASPKTAYINDTVNEEENIYLLMLDELVRRYNFALKDLNKTWKALDKNRVSYKEDTLIYYWKMNYPLTMDDYKVIKKALKKKRKSIRAIEKLKKKIPRRVYRKRKKEPINQGSMKKIVKRNRRKYGF